MSGRFFVTGDIHGKPTRVIDFAKKMKLKKSDCIVVGGDAGFNYYKNERDASLKEYTNKEVNCDILCIHGNHEANPEYMDTMKEKEWHGGVVYYEEKYPRILYAKDGEVYDFDGKKVVALGGAYSIDKDYRLRMHWMWHSDEQMTPEVMKRCEENLERVNWKVDYVFSHTVPLSAEPIEFFMEGVDQSKVDKTMENWLESIKKRLTFEKWYAGHYHCDVVKCSNINIMYYEVKELGKDEVLYKAY